ncbi:hypothetical protein ACJZ2D_001171 [Fusarium nematophilum]
MPEHQVSPRSNPPVGPPASDKSVRRNACNQCKQQKLRCSLLTPDTDGAHAGGACSRCQRLGMECKVEVGFQRVRKRRQVSRYELIFAMLTLCVRRRSAELEQEVQNLRQQLQAQSHDNLSPSMPGAATANDLDVSGFSPESVAIRQNEMGNFAINASDLTSNSATENTESEPSIAPGVTTRPGVDEPIRSRLASNPVARPRALGNVVLSVEEIEELFAMSAFASCYCSFRILTYASYFAQYHPFLPLIDPTQSPHRYHEVSELLFWTIIAVSSRRLRARPTLFPSLARSVTDLLWKTVRSIPYSLAAVQALAIICTWTFPTSSSTADSTFMLAGLMLQLGTQMGLHRALNVQDFVRVPLKLSEAEFKEWSSTWKTCNIVAQSVSVGSGLPILIQYYDWLPAQDANGSERLDETCLDVHLRIEKFRHTVSQSLGSLDPSNDSSQARLMLYRLLHQTLADLEHTTSTSSSEITSYYLSAARLHLENFYLLDDPDTADFAERIAQLYQTAYDHIEQAQKLNRTGITFSEYCPFFCYQSFVCAAFTLLKILSNRFFATVIDVSSGTKLLDAVILSLRSMSLVNNDLPARLGEVVGFFCTLSDPTVLGGVAMQDVCLRRVRHRLSMSVVYDSLWVWRMQFPTSKEAGDDVEGSGDNVRVRDLVDGSIGPPLFGLQSPAEWAGFFNFDQMV